MRSVVLALLMVLGLVSSAQAATRGVEVTLKASEARNAPNWDTGQKSGRGNAARHDDPSKHDFRSKPIDAANGADDAARTR